MSVVCDRYARALYSVPGDPVPDEVLGNLEVFGRWLDEAPALKAALENPGIPYSAKRAVVEKLAAEADFTSVALRFVLLVVKNRRINQWKEFTISFRNLCDLSKGVLRGKVTSADKMTDNAVKKLSERLQQILGNRVMLDARVSGALLGGLQLRFGSTVYDGSIAASLKSLHDAFVKG